MRQVNRRTLLSFLLAALAAVTGYTDDKLQRAPSGKSIHAPAPESIRLVDGVYPVVVDDESSANVDAQVKTLELEVVGVEGNGQPSAGKIRIFARPLLRFETSPNFDFKFENNECTQVEFENTAELKKFSLQHAPTRLAIVIDNRVITHHKLRGPLESDKVRVTCCTVGGGDHLHKHMMKLKTLSEAVKRQPQADR